MNNKPRETLCTIIRDYGRDVARDTKRCKALLNDLCGGEHKREINVLVSAMEERVASDLLTPQPNIPHSIWLPQLAKRLHDDKGITTEFAQWAVESWALALGVIQEHDLADVKKEQERLDRERQERERKEREERERKEREERERKEKEERERREREERERRERERKEREWKRHWWQRPGNYEREERERKEREERERKEREERERKTREERERKEREERERREREEREQKSMINANHSQGFNDHPRDVQQSFVNILFHFYGDSSEQTKKNRNWLIKYLNKLVARCSALPLTTGTGGRDLETTYVPNCSALSVFCKRHDNKAPRLLLLGETGMGKSALVNYLTYCLAKANQEYKNSSNWLSRIPFWNYGALLPIRVLLHEFSRFLEEHKADRGNVELLLSFLRDNNTNSTPISQSTLNLIEEHLLATANTNYFQAVLLFDGLEDVFHNNNMLSRTREMILDVSSTYPNTPILVTCHTRYYNTCETCQSLVTQHHFHKSEIHPLNDEEIEQFVVTTHGNDKLWEAIKFNSELYKMAKSPLLLTMMVIVYANGSGNILQSQAELYLRCIEQLLLKWQCKERCEQWRCETWECSRGQPHVLQQLGIPNFSRHELMKLIAKLGYEIHKTDSNSSDRPTELSRETTEDTITNALREYVRGDNAQERCQEAARKIIAIACRNGLLFKNEVNERTYYHFAYRSFQEFLAGYALKDRKNPVEVWLQHTSDIHWHEVIKLMVSFLVNNTKEFEQPSNLIRELRMRSKIERGLAQELENFVVRDRVTENSSFGLNEREKHEPEEQEKEEQKENKENKERERREKEFWKKLREWWKNTMSSWGFTIKWTLTMIVCGIVLCFVVFHFIGYVLLFLAL